MGNTHTVKLIDGHYRVISGNQYTHAKANAQARHLNSQQSNAPKSPITFDDITSGLGIGGVGSDDYNINTEQPTPNIPTGKPRPNGGGQLWEPCPRCGEEPVHLDCGYCGRHCQC